MNFTDWLLHPIASLKNWQEQRVRQGLEILKYRYQIFRALLEDNHQAISLLTEISAKLRAGSASSGLSDKVSELVRVVGAMIGKQEQLSATSVNGLAGRYNKICGDINKSLASLPKPESYSFCVPLTDIEPEMLPIVGGKSVTLAQLKRIEDLRVPDGFVITAPAARFFLENQGLFLSIMSRCEPFLKRREVPGAKELEAVRREILAAPLPPSLLKKIEEVSGPYFQESRQVSFAVRSSAVSEDSRKHSFAGQYETVLNVSGPDSLIAALKQVIASAFSARNISYRLRAGLDPLAYDLAVLCLEMVTAKFSGILFTKDPNDSDSGRMLVSAVFGLGELAVAGSGNADIYRPSRFGDEDPLAVIAEKSDRIVAQSQGGAIQETLPEELRLQPVLSPDQLAELARAGMEIEMKFGCPQDIEWAYGADERLTILQSRSFRMAVASADADRVRAEGDILLQGGQASCRGQAIGKAHLVGRRDDLRDLPEGPLVLVLRQSLPDAVEVLDRVNAVVVDLGNPIDHLSCIAREYGIPMLTGTEFATSRILDGTWIVVNAGEGRIYRATDKEAKLATQMHARKKSRGEQKKQTPENPTLGQLYESLVPLHLTDAYGPTFSIQECRSFHDIIRYIHEKAVLAMFESGDHLIELPGNVVRHLQTDVPFFVSLIDLGGGLSSSTGKGRFITAEDIVSTPFTALWRGVLTPGLHWGPPTGAIAVGGTISRWMTDHRAARPIGMPNYAIITRDYLNLNARMDFHFVMVDALCGIDPSANYIRFRFKGGGTVITQQRRRIRCIAEILETYGFLCDARDDLITASLHGATTGVMEENLVAVGRILGFTRLLDSAMVNDAAVTSTARAFLEGNYRVEIEKVAN